MLLSTGKTLEELGCDRYEISLCEPLHDFKNLITHILEELRQQLGGVPRDVKETITQYCKGILGKAAKQEYDWNTQAFINGD